jgi:hypothetical protein
MIEDGLKCFTYEDAVAVEKVQYMREEVLWLVKSVGGPIAKEVVSKSLS